MEAKELAELAAEHAAVVATLREEGDTTLADDHVRDATAAALASIALTLSGSYVKVFIKNK